VSAPPAEKRAEKPQHPALAWFARVYGLDVRSLALFRVGLALLILGDLFMRAQDLNAFYTDWGVLPRDTFTRYVADPWIISLHLLSGKWQVEAVMFATAALFAIMLLLGWRTRFATIATWVMLTSLQNRNPVILQGGDTLLRMMTFWAMFLPLGLVYSVDAALDSEPERKKPQTIFSAGTVALMAQIAMVYWFAVSLKTGPEWRTEGSAVYYALSLEQMAHPLGRWLTQFPNFLRFLTFFTLVVEAAAPIFLFIPWRSQQIRTLAVLFLISLHLGFATFLNVGHFPFVGSVIMLPMLTSWFWDYARPASEYLDRKMEGRKQLRIYYDANCAFCRRAALILRTLVSPATELREGQSDAAIYQQMQENKSWVLTRADKTYYRTDALAELFSHSPVFVLWPIAWALRLPPIMGPSDRLYAVIERSRPTLSRVTGFLTYRPLRWQVTPLANTFATFTLLYVMAWNIGMGNPDLMMPQEARWYGIALRVDQIWDMFSPGPLRDDGWYVIDARLKNGTHIDLMRNGAPVSFDRPSADQVYAQYKNERWRKYMMNLYAAQYQPYRLFYGRYLCRTWNQARGKTANDPDAVDTFQIYFLARTNVAVGVSAPIQHWMLHEHHCWE
jgi:predicted DCC family thiol-disulfide oxidoreductase YuxK